MTKDKHAAGREQRREMRIVEQLLRERSRAAAGVFLAVRWVCEDQVEVLPGSGELRNDGERVLHTDGERIHTQAGHGGVLP